MYYFRTLTKNDNLIHREFILIHYFLFWKYMNDKTLEIRAYYGEG